MSSEPRCTTEQALWAVRALALAQLACPGPVADGAEAAFWSAAPEPAPDAAAQFRRLADQCAGGAMRELADALAATPLPSEEGSTPSACDCLCLAVVCCPATRALARQLGARAFDSDSQCLRDAAHTVAGLAAAAHVQPTAMFGCAAAATAAAWRSLPPPGGPAMKALARSLAHVAAACLGRDGPLSWSPEPAARMAALAALLPPLTATVESAFASASVVRRVFGEAAEPGGDAVLCAMDRRVLAQVARDALGSAPSGAPAASLRRRIAVLGGSFDPITQGHLRVARECLLAGAADAVWLVPCADRRDKSLSASAAQRFAMACAAVDSVLPADLAVFVKPFELDASEATATFALMHALSVAHASSAEFAFVIGTDLVAALSRWRYGERLLTETRFIVVARPGAPAPEGARLPAQCDWLQRPGMELLEVSSTEVRAALRADPAHAAALLPPLVMAHIVRNQLYAVATSPTAGAAGTPSML